ncbi:MAG: peptidylprolyl isomerase [Hyphomicrobium sp.]
MKNTLAFRLIAAAALGTALSVGTLSAAQADDAVIAKLNGKEIKESDMALAETEIGPELHNMPASSKRRVLVEYIIETRLFAQAAEGAKLNTGAAFEQRAEYWRQRAMRDEFYDKTIKSSVSDALAKSIYEDKVKMIPPEDEVEARHILVDSEDKAKELAERAGKGEDFAKLAAENSKDPGSKTDGGKLGFFGKGQMVKEFEDAAFALQKGEVSKPVKSQFGWHIIKLEDRRQKPLPTYDEVKDRLIGSMVQQKAQQVSTDLRGKAQIEYIDQEVKLQVEQDAIKAAAQKKLMDDQMKQQIESMDAKEKQESK